MNWNDLLAAFAIYLVLEGLLPFANPSGFKQVMRQVTEYNEQKLRTMGLGSMIAGVILLYFVRA